MNKLQHSGSLFEEGGTSYETWRQEEGQEIYLHIQIGDYFAFLKIEILGMGYTLASVQIPNGEQPICGVVLEPNILFRDDNSNIVMGTSIPDENTTTPFGEREPPIVLRSRWYR